MIERIRQLGDAQQSQSATDAELSPALEGVVMSEAKATELLQERTLRTVAGLQASAATIQVPDALQGVQEAVNNVRGFEQAEMDIAPFLWVPKPSAMQSFETVRRSEPWLTETHGVAGWNISWRNCDLGALSLLMFKNNDEFTEGALQAAVIPLDLASPDKKDGSIIDTMLQEGSQNVRRMALRGILSYAKTIQGRMTLLHKKTGRGSVPPDEKYAGSYQSAAMYYMGYLLLTDQTPTRQLHSLSLLYDGKHQALADSLGISEWPTNPAAHNRMLQTQHTRDDGDKLYTPPHMAPYAPAESYFRMLGHLDEAFTYGSFAFNFNKVFDQGHHDAPAWQFARQPWLYRSSENMTSLQGAFALPQSAERRRWFSRSTGGVIGKRAVAVSAEPALARGAYTKIQDLVSAPYLQQLGA